MTDSSFQMSQGYDVIPPKTGRAYPILCEEWDHLKGQIRGIKTSFGTYHTVGSVLVGAAITTLISILLGAYSASATNDPKISIIAWAVTVTTFITGSACLYFARESRTVSDKQADEVVRQMELIEKRFAQT
jgi:hypothetical protein